jgi:hypothetical protein
MQCEAGGGAFFRRLFQPLDEQRHRVFLWSMSMKVELALLKPNPLRDFSIDPIDQEVVEAIKESIRQDGFWSGLPTERGRRNRDCGWPPPRPGSDRSGNQGM